MKVQTILTAAVLSAILASSATPIVDVQHCTANAAETGRQIAAENGIELSTDAAAASLAVFSDANGGVLPALTYGESGAVTCIDGSVSDRKVTCQKDAEAVLADVAGLLCISANDFVFLNCQNSITNNVYTFRQTYCGIPVEDGYVSLVVDKKTGAAKYLNSTAKIGLTLDVEPSISVEEAAAIMQRSTGAAVCGTPALTVFCTADDTPVLAWIATTESADAAFILVDARTGGVLTKTGVQNETKRYSGVRNPITGLFNFEISYAYVNGKLSSVDPVRNIWIVGRMENGGDRLDDYYMKQYYQTTNKQYYFENRLYGIPQSLAQHLGSDWLYGNVRQYADTRAYECDQTAIGVQYRVRQIYDFYKNTLSWRGTDGIGSILAVNPELNPTKYESAFASPVSNFLGFLDLSASSAKSQGRKQNNSCALDSVGHEYTHRVTTAKVRWERCDQPGGSFETSCICEGYSDIMGEYAEGKLTWTYSEDSYVQNVSGKTVCMRDLSGENPNALQFEGPQYDYNVNALQNARRYSNVDYHQGATVLTRVAYLMHKQGIPADLAEKIWFQSMDYLPKGASGANFANCKTAVSRAANDVMARYGYSASDSYKYLMYINNAFYAAGI